MSWPNVNEFPRNIYKLASQWIVGWAQTFPAALALSLILCYPCPLELPAEDFTKWASRMAHPASRHLRPQDVSLEPHKRLRMKIIIILTMILRKKAFGKCSNWFMQYATMKLLNCWIGHGNYAETHEASCIGIRATNNIASKHEVFMSESVTITYHTVMDYECYGYAVVQNICTLTLL